MTVLEKLKSELNDLCEKMRKLEDALSCGILKSTAPRQYQLLQVQHAAMTTYAVILRARIEDMEDGANEEVNG